MTHQRTPCRDCRTVIDEGVRCAPCQARREAMIARGQAGTRTWASPEHHPAAMPDGWDILDVRRAEVELAKKAFGKPCRGVGGRLRFGGKDRGEFEQG